MSEHQPENIQKLRSINRRRFLGISFGMALISAGSCNMEANDRTRLLKYPIALSSAAASLACLYMFGFKRRTRTQEAVSVPTQQPQPEPIEPQQTTIESQKLGVYEAIQIEIKDPGQRKN